MRIDLSLQRLEISFLQGRLHFTSQLDLFHELEVLIVQFLLHDMNHLLFDQIIGNRIQKVRSSVNLFKSGHQRLIIKLLKLRIT